MTTTRPPERAERETRGRIARRRLRERLHRAVHPECGWPEQLRRIRRRVLWAVLATAIVSVPILAFALVGLPHVIRGPLVRNVIAGGAGALRAPDAPEFPNSVELLTSAVLLPGNRAEILANGNGTFERLWGDLRAARRSITVQMYYVGPGRVVNDAVAILAERARAGVDVFLLYDAFGAQDVPRSLHDALLAAGVRTAEFRPLRSYELDRANHRSHVRGIVIDGAVAYTGGFGLDDKWLGGGRTVGEWRETNVRFTGPAAFQLQGVFVAKWAEAVGGRSRYDALLSAGVRLWEYQPTTIHAKTLVVDGLWSAVATMNFDNRSLAYNNEVAFLARDRRLGAELDSMFLDDLRFAEEIRLDTFRRRPWTERVLEWGGSVIAGVL